MQYPEGESASGKEGSNPAEASDRRVEAKHEKSQAYLVFDSKTMQSCSVAIVPGLPALVLSNTSKGTFEADVALKAQTDISAQPGLQKSCPTSDCEPEPRVEQNVESNDGPTEDNDGGKEKLYCCQKDGCGQSFSSWNFLREHMFKHETLKSLKCSYTGCDRVFSWPANLRYHEKTHENDRSEVCPLAGCGRRFFTGQRLRVHMRTHTGEKPFSCDKCGKSFTTAGNLKNHTRTHTGEKPFKCTEAGCSKQFAEQSSLKKHLLVHTKDKPYTCDVCGRGFTQQGSRSVHMKKHAIAGTILLEYSGAETVVFPNVSTDHVVTVTTQPPEDVGHLGLQSNVPEEDFGGGESESAIRLGASGANVVVLSQPEELVSMAPGLHAAQREPSEEIEYESGALLHDGDFDHEEIASNMSVSSHDDHTQHDIEISSTLD